MLTLDAPTDADMVALLRAQGEPRRGVALRMAGVEAGIGPLCDLHEIHRLCRRIGLRFRLRERRMARLVRCFSDAAVEIVALETRVS